MHPECAECGRLHNTVEEAVNCTRPDIYRKLDCLGYRVFRWVGWPILLILAATWVLPVLAVKAAFRAFQDFRNKSSGEGDTR